jgi:hypothetical protein
MGRYELAAGVPVWLQWPYVLKPGCTTDNYATVIDSDPTVDSNINYTKYE